jgi:hypothetical protein
VANTLREESPIKADATEITRAAISPAAPAGGVWSTVRGFILWRHERGTVQYDIMVTLILLFLFFSPRFIPFNDKPVTRNPHATGVLVYPDGKGGLVYEVDARAVDPWSGPLVQGQLLRVIEPISGEVSISRYEAVTDKQGKVSSYKVWVNRQ